MNGALLTIEVPCAANSESHPHGIYSIIVGPLRLLRDAVCRYSFPAADADLLGTFYPELIGCMLEMQDVDDDYVDGATNLLLPISHAKVLSAGSMRLKVCLSFSIV